MNTEQNEKNPTKFYVWGIIAIVVLGAVFMAYKKDKINTINNKDAEVELAVQRIQGSLRQAEEYLRSGREEEGYDVLRTIILDTSTPRIPKGTTLAYIADLFMLKSSRSNAYARDYIFVAEPFTSLLDTTENDQSRRHFEGVYSIYRLSTDYGNFPISLYRLAEWELIQAVEAQESGGEDILKDHIQKATLYISQADKVLPDAEASSRFSLLPYSSWLRATLFSALAHLETDPTKKKDFLVSANVFFTEALRKNNDPDAIVHQIWARFYYAAFLHQFFGESEKVLIQELLEDLVSVPKLDTYAFSRYMQYLSKIDDPKFYPLRHDKSMAYELAGYSQSFKELLVSLGWKF